MQRVIAFIEKLRSHPVLQFGLFVAVGMVNTAFNYMVYATLLLIGLAPQLSLLFSFVLGVIWNFFTHGRVVFAARGYSRMPAFIMVYVFLYFLNAAGLETLLHARLNPFIAQGILVIPAALLAFIGISRVLTDRFPWQKRPARSPL